MNDELKRFPLKAHYHPDEHHGHSVLLEYEDYEALSALWHLHHGERVVRVFARKGAGGLWADEINGEQGKQNGKMFRF